MALFLPKLIPADAPAPAVTDSGILIQLCSLCIPAAVYSAFAGFPSVKNETIRTFPISRSVLLLVFCAALLTGSVSLSCMLSSGSAGLQEFSDRSFPTFLCYVLIPAAVEELAFRGLMYSRLEKTGAFNAVFFTSLLFAMYHFDLRMFPVYLLSGVILGLCVYVTGSVFASVLVHFLYNLFIFFFSRQLNEFLGYMSGPSLAVVTAVLSVVSLLLLALAFGECRHILRGTAESGEYVPFFPSTAESFLRDLFSLPFLACVVIFIASVLFNI